MLFIYEFSNSLEMNSLNDWEIDELFNIFYLKMYLLCFIIKKCLNIFLILFRYLNK